MPYIILTKNSGEIMGLFGGKKVEATNGNNPMPDDLMFGKSDVVEKIVERKLKEKDYDEVVLEKKMDKHFEMKKIHEKDRALDHELKALKKENEELKEEIRALKGNVASVGKGVGGTQRGA